jgi:LmbE family N-acetylglucosaminyl deacetylase
VEVRLSLPDFTYFDLRSGTRSGDIATLFPGWQTGQEHLVVFVPHDDDLILGTGYAVLAAQANGAQVSAIIFCDGRAGYSRPEERNTVVATRREESTTAYARLGIPPEHIIRLEYPDFSAFSRMGWLLAGGQSGSFAIIIPVLRKLRATRVMIPNGYREHIDHEAVARIGAYDAPQVGDPIVVDWGEPVPVRSLLEYGVWSDFTPEDALVHRAPPVIRANRALAAPRRAEEAVAHALQAFQSQQQIIAGLLQGRQARRLSDGRVIEVYRWFDPRPPLDYRPYCAAVEKIEKG